MPFEFHSEAIYKEYIQRASEKELKKAVECAKTFEWENYIDKDNLTPDTWPKKLKCKKTGIIVVKTSENSPVVYYNNELLMLTCDDVIIRDIIT